MRPAALNRAATHARILAARTVLCLTGQLSGPGLQGSAPSKGPRKQSGVQNETLRRCRILDVILPCLRRSACQRTAGRRQHYSRCFRVPSVKKYRPENSKEGRPRLKRALGSQRSKPIQQKKLGSGGRLKSSALRWGRMTSKQAKVFMLPNQPTAMGNVVLKMYFEKLGAPILSYRKRNRGNRWNHHFRIQEFAWHERLTLWLWAWRPLPSVE